MRSDIMLRTLAAAREPLDLDSVWDPPRSPAGHMGLEKKGTQVKREEVGGWVKSRDTSDRQDDTDKGRR